MADISKQIIELITSSGKTAPQLTHALKFIGGNMQNGIYIVAEYFRKEGINIGIKKGLARGRLEGAAFMAFIATIIESVRRKISEDKALETEGQEILRGLEDGLKDAEKNVSLTNDTPLIDKPSNNSN